MLYLSKNKQVANQIFFVLLPIWSLPLYQDENHWDALLLFMFPQPSDHTYAIGLLVLLLVGKGEMNCFIMTTVNDGELEMGFVQKKSEQ